MKKLLLFLTVCLLMTHLAHSQGATSQGAVQDSFLSKLDIYSKTFAAVVAGIGVLFGLPLAVLNFKKTRAEIRKIELEAMALEAKGTIEAPLPNTTNRQYISITDSKDVKIQILADPRFLGPLLLLLDFIIAYILVHISSYLLGLVGLPLADGVILLLSAILFVPILKESWRVRKSLRLTGRDGEF